MGKAIGHPVGDTTIQVSIHEDNAGALDLAKTASIQFSKQAFSYKDYLVLREDCKVWD